MFSQIKRHRTSIVIYYSFQGEITRHPTGVNITLDSKGNPIDWDDKKELLKTNADKYADKYNIINKWKKVADEIITENLNEGVKISAGVLSKALKDYTEGKTSKKTAEVVKTFTDFHERKKKEFISDPNLVESSIRDYNCLLSTLSDWDKEKGTVLLINEINTLWLEDFVMWLREYRPVGSKTKGGLNEQTIKKRIDILIIFFNYLKELGLVESNDFIRAIKRKIHIPDKRKTTLTVDEIYKLYDTNFTKESYNRIKDIFVFVCLTGLRFGDVETLEKKHLEKRTILVQSDEKEKMIKKEYYLIKKIPDKTKKYNIEVEIPLTPLAYDIFEKYNFKFTIISNQKTNEYLHELLKESNLFNGDSKELDKKTKKYKLRYEILNFHKGRDTFITNMVATTPLHEVMKMSGHRDILTLQKYIDNTRELNLSFIDTLDRPSKKK